NVLSRTQLGFSGEALRRLLEREGLRQRSDGLYQASNADGTSRFTLGNLDAQALAQDGLDALTLRGLTLMLDVPRAPAGAEAFDAMLACAQRLAQALDARVVDDTEAELAPEALSVIRARITEFQQVMSQHGIPAGSGMALRLFA
ncbi:MAG TPA: cell division protein ZipA C-terminal FtsZ-binding domain-containing protein, partial [Rhodocyclaceae bacterium]|nr:cell division protein ZipA C-terminal FtsZ-binding domain-containing protein [Rhodocyclaceae bacterium]